MKNSPHWGICLKPGKDGSEERIDMMEFDSFIEKFPIKLNSQQKAAVQAVNGVCFRLFLPNVLWANHYRQNQKDKKHHILACV